MSQFHIWPASRIQAASDWAEGQGLTSNQLRLLTHGATPEPVPSKNIHELPEPPVEARIGLKAPEQIEGQIDQWLRFEGREVIYWTQDLVAVEVLGS